PSLTIDKETTNLHVDHAGQLISYTIDEDNTGNIDLTGVTLKDTSFADSGATLALASGDTDHDTVLDVGETWHYTASHTVTQTEMNAGGNLVNTAFVHTHQTTEQHDDATTAVVQKPSLTIDKSTADVSVDHAGQVISYTVDVHNTGNIDLTDVSLTDPTFADTATTLTLASGDTDHDTVLDVGETWHYTASHTVTQTEMNAGGNLVNTA